MGGAIDMAMNAGMTVNNTSYDASTTANSGKSTFDLFTSLMADSLNGMFEDLLAIGNLLSTGILSVDQMDILERLDDAGVKIGDVGLNDDDNYERININKDTGAVTRNTAANPNAVNTNPSPTSNVVLAYELNDPQALMENPGTLMVIQTVMGQMKDALNSMQSIAKQPGDQKSTAHQNLQQGLR
jgi:hypothetical protein